MPDLFPASETAPQHSEQYVFLIHYNDFSFPDPTLLWPSKKEERIEWAWKTYKRQMEQAEWLSDDMVPSLNVATGTEIFAEALGCKVYRPEDNMPFALPMITNPKEAAKLKSPELEESSLMLLFDIADELKRRAGDGAILKLVDIQSPMDIVAQIWDKADLFISMIEEPELVKETAGKVRKLFFSFVDEWFSRYGREFIAHYPYYYMPQGMTLSEDEVGSVSTDMFEEFFLDELNEISARYGGLGMHCCADARHQWDNFKKIDDLRLLNLVQPDGLVREAYTYFGPHVAHMHSPTGTGRSDLMTGHMPNDLPEGVKVVIQVDAETEEEALRLSEQLWQACGRD